MKSILITIALLLPSFTIADDSVTTPAICYHRANVAAGITIGKKRFDLDKLKEDFILQLNGHRGGNPDIINALADWYNSWGAEVMEAWFENIYNSQDNPQEAYKKELESCKLPGEGKPLPKKEGATNT